MPMQTRKATGMVCDETGRSRPCMGPTAPVAYTARPKCFPPAMLDFLDRYGSPLLALASAVVIVAASYLRFLPASSRVDLGLGILFLAGGLVGWKDRGAIG